MAERVCRVCGKPVVRRENEKTREFVKRQTCSPECTHALRKQLIRKFRYGRGPNMNVGWRDEDG